MGEAAKKIGEKLEQFGGNYLLTHLGWQELLRDCEIKCTRATHKNPEGKSKKTHGIDLLSKFDNPYSNAGQAVLIECKNRQMISITQPNVNDWLREIINNIECAQSAHELSDIGVDTSILNTGLLLIHANDTFDEGKFNSILKNLSTQNRRNPINIFIASNREINMWTSLFEEIEKNFPVYDKFDFVYPSINGSSKTLAKYIPINALFSKYLFAQYKHDEESTFGTKKIQEEMTDSIIFSFDDISFDGFKYVWSMFKYFQMEGTNSYIFYFYPRKNTDSQLLTKENFISAIEQDSVKVSDDTKSKIQIQILDNRGLSPVETKKG